MTHRMKMDHADKRRRLDDMVQGLVGMPVDRPEGALKVSGSVPYAHESQLPNTAYGVLVRSPVARGLVRRLDSDTVEELPGILAVIADERMLRNPAQGTANEAPAQGVTEIYYLGQPIALIVAETFEQARHGAQILAVHVDPIGDLSVDPDSDEIPVEMPEDSQHAQGDIETAMKEAAFTVDAVYRTPPHNSAPMEPHASVAEWDGDTLTLRCSYQMLKYNRNELADAIGIPAENVRIRSPYVGGGFGSKLGIGAEAVAAAIAARQLGRPVLVALTRQQVFEAVMRRSETRQRIRLAADEDGRLTGLAHENRVSNLPGEVFAEPVAQATHFMYGGANRRIGQEIVRLNRTCAGSVRAPGEAVGVQALENAMDELATAAGIDPVELRKRNIPDRHPETDAHYASRRFAEALDEGARRFDWQRRQAQPGSVREGEWLIGMGMASAARVNKLSPSQARVTFLPDGSARVETDMTDIGTGTYTILTQIAGEMLGLPIDRVETLLGDTEYPPASGSGGSWGAASSGSSVFLACEDLRRQLCRRLECRDEDLTLRDGQAIVGNRSTTLPDVLDGEQLSALGEIEPGDTERAAHQAAYGAHFAEIAVSEVTGETRLRRMLGVFGAGRILNPKTARSQCIGGIIFGIGIALTEELAHDPRDGHIVNRDFAEYHIPVNLDVPPIEIHFLEERDDWANPLQSKGIGELGISGAAAAVTNAIYNACGVRIRDYPATLDKVLSGLD